MKSNIKYYGALQKYTLSSDYPSNEIYLHIEDVEAIPIEWIEEWGRKNGMSESMSLRVMIEDWEKENDK